MSKISFILLPLALIAIAVIIFVVYSIHYKKKINEKLHNDESTAHLPMTSTESVGRILNVVGVVIISAFILIQLSDIKSEAENTKYSLQEKISDLSCQVEELKQTIAKQSSLLISFEYSYGEIDTENHTVEITFRCVPKSVSADTEISIAFGGRKIQLHKNSDGRYSGTTEQPLFERAEPGIILQIISNGITVSEQIEDAPQMPLYIDCLPSMGYSSTIGIEEKEKLTVEGSLGMIFDEAEISGLKLYSCLNDDIKKNYDVTAGEDVYVNEKYSFKAEDSYNLILEFKDCYGYTHKEKVIEYNNNSQYISDEYEYLVTILDKNGNVIVGGF